jgi:hypothetical protein
MVGSSRIKRCSASRVKTAVRSWPLELTTAEKLFFTAHIIYCFYMKSREQVLEYANLFANFFRLHGLTNKGNFPPISDDALKETRRSEIEGCLKLFRENVKPNHSSIAEGRPQRTLSMEINRLWSQAWRIYRQFCFSSLPMKFQEITELNPEDCEDFKRMAAKQFHDIDLTLLKEHETPGDDFYLLVAHTLDHSDEEKVIESLAHLGHIPPYSSYVMYAIFGLLIQAQRYQEQSKVTEAYTCIIDANVLIGLAAGARFVVERLPAAAIKRRAVVNNTKKNQKNDRYKLLVQELFYSLGPKDDKDKRQAWKTAAEAMKVVWPAFERQTKSTKAAKSPLSYEVVQTICRNLQARDKTEGLYSLDIRAEVIEVSVSANPDKPAGA